MLLFPDTTVSLSPSPSPPKNETRRSMVHSLAPAMPRLSLKRIQDFNNCLNRRSLAMQATTSHSKRLARSLQNPALQAGANGVAGSMLIISSFVAQAIQKVAI